METPGDRELGRRKGETERGRIRAIRRIYLALLGMCVMTLLLAHGRLAGARRACRDSDLVPVDVREGQVDRVVARNCRRRLGVVCSYRAPRSPRMPMSVNTAVLPPLSDQTSNLCL
jgi:hypothetical protein